ncbi:MAG: energy transducer TonB [Terriglobia bacterium]
MNPVEEQKALIEFLESALQEASKSPNTSPEKLGMIRRKLEEARLDLSRLSQTSSVAVATEPLPEVVLPQLTVSKETSQEVVSRSTSDSVSRPLPIEKKSSVEAPAPQEVPIAPSRTVDHSSPNFISDLNLELKVDSRLKTFLNNLKSIFVHETKIYNISSRPIETDLMIEAVPWYKTLKGNIKSVFRPEAKNYSISSKPVDTDLILETKPWYLTVFSQIKYLVLREERPEIHVSAQPVEVDEIFKEYKFRSTSLVYSTIIHVSLVLAIVIIPTIIVKGRQNTQANTDHTILLEPTGLVNLPPKAEKAGGGGGGGRRDPTPASKGKLPRLSDKQLTPPTPKIVNEEPVLPVEPTLIVPQLAQLPNVNMPNYGDPLGIPGPPSSGPGTGGGIGTGTGGGVGPGKGGGYGPGEGGGVGGGVFRVGGGVSAPSVIFRVEPTYSEEARKAKYQGVVVLSAIVRKDGTIEIQRVVRGLGLGLDENAIAALRQWKFRPGMRNGAPVDVALNIEVNFSLR